MKKNKFCCRNCRTILALGIFACLFLMRNLEAQPCKEIVGYYPDWDLPKRNYLVNPATITYSKYTVINYAFYKPNPDGSIEGLDKSSDSILLMGKMDANHVPVSGTSLIDLAHQSHVKVVLSIGGWDDSGNFPGIVGDDVKRSTFVHNCVQQIKQFHFDGIDIDWEYPGYKDHNGTPADKANFTLFMQQLRDSLNTYGNPRGQTLLLTAAIAASPEQMEQFEWDRVINLLDFINLMTYDINGDWSDIANHNAPLYSPSQGDLLSDDIAVKTLLRTYHVPPDKINLGMAFYGYAVITQGSPALFASSTKKTDTITFSDANGGTSYYSLINQLPLFTYHWDSLARVPYLTGNGTLNTFVSYDDPNSIAIKARYILENNLHGAMMWEITGDCVESSPGSGKISATPLTDTLNAVLCRVNAVITDDSFNPTLYCDPVSGLVDIGLSGFGEKSTLQLTNASGKILFTVKVNKEIMQLDLKNYPSGIYFAFMLNDKKEKMAKARIVKP